MLRWLSLDILIVLMDGGWFLVWENLFAGRAQLKLCSTCVRTYLGLILKFVKSYLPEFTLPSLVFDYFFNPSCVVEVFTLKYQSRYSLFPFCLFLLPIMSTTHWRSGKKIRKAPPPASLKIWGGEVLIKILRILMIHPELFSGFVFRNCVLLSAMAWKPLFFVFVFFIASIWSLSH